mmetsp:Transcript_19266/g.56185  ORF Transcript_19266/g.56185 Transcript_19266/m.56185 type:complete len:261 (-) Transcript_19266:1309-2091(-)
MKGRQHQRSNAPMSAKIAPPVFFIYFLHPALSSLHPSTAVLLQRFVPRKGQSLVNVLRPVPREGDLGHFLPFPRVRPLGQVVVPILLHLVEDLGVAVKARLHRQAAVWGEHGDSPQGPLVVHARPFDLVLHHGDIVVVQPLVEDLLFRHPELLHVLPGEVHPSAGDGVLSHVAEDVGDLERYPEGEGRLLCLLFRVPRCTPEHRHGHEPHRPCYSIAVEVQFVEGVVPILPQVGNVHEHPPDHVKVGLYVHVGVLRLDVQ